MKKRINGWMNEHKWIWMKCMLKVHMEGQSNGLCVCQKQTFTTQAHMCALKLPSSFAMLSDNTLYFNLSVKLSGMSEFCVQFAYTWARCKKQIPSKYPVQSCRTQSSWMDCINCSLTKRIHMVLLRVKNCIVRTESNLRKVYFQWTQYWRNRIDLLTCYAFFTQNNAKMELYSRGLTRNHGASDVKSLNPKTIGKCYGLILQTNIV